MDKEVVVSGKRMAPLKKIYLRILFSGIFGWFIYVLGAFADSIIGGLFLGEEALAAIEIVSPLASVIYFVGYLVAVGCGLLHAKCIGRNDFKEADSVFSTAIIFSTVSGIILALILFFIKDFWLDLYGLEGEIRRFASDYYDPIVLIGLTLPVGLTMYNSSACDGDALFTLISDISIAVVNIVLSLSLVGVMETKGLSIATLISTVVGYGIPFLRLFSKRNTCHFKFTFSFKHVLGSMKLGISTYLGLLAVAAIDIIMNLYITETWDAGYVAPYSVVNFSLEIASALTIVGTTLSTMMGFAVGEENTKDIKDLLAYSKKVSFYVGLFFTVLFLACTPIWPTLFGLEKEEYIIATYFASISIGLTYIPQAYMHTSVYFYMTYEKMMPAIIASAANSFVFPLICPIVMALLFGYNGFVVGFAVANILSVAAVLTYLLIRNKGKICVIEEKAKFIASIDLVLDKKSISKSIEELKNILEEQKIDPIVANRAQVSIEESLNITIDKNNKNKKLFSRIIVAIDDDKLKIIVKDTGKVFDITNPDQNVDSLSNFLYVMALSKASKAVNYVSSSLNGNTYQYDLKQSNA